MLYRGSLYLSHRLTVEKTKSSRNASQAPQRCHRLVNPPSLHFRWIGTLPWSFQLPDPGQHQFLWDAQLGIYSEFLFQNVCRRKATSEAPYPSYRTRNCHQGQTEAGHDHLHYYMPSSKALLWVHFLLFYLCSLVFNKYSTIRECVLTLLYPSFSIISCSTHCI